MKFIVYILLFVNLICANTQFDIFGYPHTNKLYQKNIKKYFHTRAALQIDIEKASILYYYKRSKYNLLWQKNGKITNIANQMIDECNKNILLNEKDIELFNLNHINTLLKTNEEYSGLDIKDTLRLDFLLTNLYDKYITYLASGNTNWKKFQDNLVELFEEDEISANWARYQLNPRKISLLKSAIKQKNILVIFDKISFRYPNAKKMVDALKHYEDILSYGGYIKIPEIKKLLKPNMTNSIVPLLRKRLRQSNDLSFENFKIELNDEPSVFIEDNAVIKNKNEIYDDILVEAIKSFQTNHGLDVDGIVGKDTIKHLNITVEEKIEQIKINLERMRWLPRSLGEKYLIVNIPDYNLRYIDNDKEILNLPVVVGKKQYPTPIFSHLMTKVVLNPYWRVPESIVHKELIPKMLENPDFLVQSGMNVHETWDEESDIYDPQSINWPQFLQTPEEKELNFYKDIPYRVIQEPSETNPLGKIKFLFQNRFSVYIHDTSEKSLFNHRQRAFSHGCIRLKTPQKLLETIADENEQLHYEETVKILKDIEKTEFELDNNIPIHIVYLTAWLDDSGVMQFRDDIYGYDQMHKDLLIEDETEDLD